MQQIRRRRRRHRQNSVRHLRRPAAHVQWRARKLLDAKPMKADAGSDDIDNRVHGADFVKMNLLQRHIVHSRLSFAQLLENGTCALAHSRRKLRIFQYLQNRAERAMLLLILGLHPRVCRRHPVLPNLFSRQLPSRHLQAAQPALQVFNVAAGIQQRAKSHVTANARKAVKIREFHGSTPQPWQASGRLCLPARKCVRREHFDTIGGGGRVSN